VIHVLGLEFDEEHNGEVRFQISLFRKNGPLQNGGRQDHPT